MADISCTAAQVAIVHPDQAEVYSLLAGATITAGQPVYAVSATGRVSPADANASAPAPQFKGIALQSVLSGQAVDVLKRGTVSGYDLSGVSYGAILYLSDTAGSLADAASVTKTVPVGQVVPLADPSLTKCLYVEANWAAGY